MFYKIIFLVKFILVRGLLFLGMKIKAVFCDLDGTLIDSIPLIMQSDKEAINEFGFSMSHQKLRELSMFHSREVAYYLMDSSRIFFDLFAFVEFRRKAFVRLLRKHKAKNLWFRGAKDFVKAVSGGYKMALVTGSRHRFVKEVFDKKTLACFKYLVTSDDVEHKKPDIEPLLKAITHFKLKREEVLFVGDSVQDALMCQRFGVMFIAKLGGISTENELRKFSPVFVAKNYAEIIRFLELIS